MEAKSKNLNILCFFTLGPQLYYGIKNQLDSENKANTGTHEKNALLNIRTIL